MGEINSVKEIVDGYVEEIENANSVIEGAVNKMRGAEPQDEVTNLAVNSDETEAFMKLKEVLEKFTAHLFEDCNHIRMVGEQFEIMDEDIAEEFKSGN